jgi:hypothetical protein
MTFSNFLLKDAELSQRIRIPDNRRVLKKTASLLAHSGDSWFLGYLAPGLGDQIFNYYLLE